MGDLSRVCSFCGQPEGTDLKLRRCSACFGASAPRYCSKPCQTRAWKAGHKLVCESRRGGASIVTSAPSASAVVAPGGREDQRAIPSPSPGQREPATSSNDVCSGGPGDTPGTVATGASVGSMVRLHSPSGPSLACPGAPDTTAAWMAMACMHDMSISLFCMRMQSLF